MKRGKGHHSPGLFWSGVVMELGTRPKIKEGEGEILDHGENPSLTHPKERGRKKDSQGKKGKGGRSVFRRGEKEEKIPVRGGL